MQISQNVKQTLNDVFQRVFDDDEIEIFEEMTADDVEEWDSLSHMNLILAVETEFNIKFDNKEILKFENVGDLMRAIEAAINKS